MTRRFVHLRPPVQPADSAPLVAPAVPAASRPLPPRWSQVNRWVTLLGALLLGLGAMCANYRQVFPELGKVFFVDADCYARMTRVRAVCAHPGLVLKEHDFENAPVGTRPHTTVPLDYLTAGLRLVLLPFYGGRALDLAGAWISPLFGLLTLAGVWYWAESAGLSGRGLSLLVLAASPIVAHGFELGRPDHQSLVMAFLALALAAEWRLWREPSRGWGIVSGVAWALGLWTSLYEPVILLVLTLLAAAIWNRRVLPSKSAAAGFGRGWLYPVACARHRRLAHRRRAGFRRGQRGGVFRGVVAADRRAGQRGPVERNIVRLDGAGIGDFAQSAAL